MQNLWVESHEGKLGSAAVHLRATMREAAGRLLGQIHDRNTRAHFLPPEAFYIAGLPPALFRREAAAAASSPGGLFQDPRSRVGVVLRYSPSGKFETPECVVLRDKACTLTLYEASKIWLGPHHNSDAMPSGAVVMWPLGLSAVMPAG